MCRPIPSFVTQSYFLQSSSVLQSRLASTSSRAEGDTFTSNDVTANDNHQLLVGSIINPSGFSIEGMYIQYKNNYDISSMCLELQFSRPRWRWVSAATIASDRYV